MWESILNYSVYTVSHCGNGQTITDGGPSATTQQAKEANKVKQSSKGHIRKHFWEGWLCPWEAMKSLIISVSTTAAYQLSAPAICYWKHWQDQWKQAPLPQFECNNNLLNEVKHDAEHTHLNYRSISAAFVCYKVLNRLLLCTRCQRRCFCRSTKWLCETQFHNRAVD